MAFSRLQKSKQALKRAKGTWQKYWSSSKKGVRYWAGHWRWKGCLGNLHQSACAHNLPVYTVHHQDLHSACYVQVVRVQRRSDKHEFALKVFNGKKPSAIKKEVDYQGQAAKLGLSPQVVSNWDITEKNRCFAMVKLDHTLKDLVRDQSILILTKDQQSRMIQICKSLSQAGILYNDAFQIKNNLMVQNGKLYLIDYGKSISSPPGDHINTQILVEIDDLFRDEHEEAKRKGIYMPMFAEEIRQAEIETGETFDYAAKFAREKKDGANKENPQEVVKSVSQATTLDSTQITKSRKKRKLSAPKKPEAKWMQVPTLKQLKIPAASEEQTLKRQHQENGRLAGAQVRTYNLRRRKRKR